MKKIIPAFLFAVLCLGCRAHMMETQGDTVTLSSLRGKPQDKGGVIRYLNGGMASWRDARRKNAEKQMTQFCAGPWKIIAEGPRSKFGADMPIGKSASFEVDQYTYVKFECEKQAK